MTESAKVKGTQLSVAFSLLAMGFSVRANTFVAPALAAFASNFPDVSMANIQLVMTFGMIGNFPMTIITGIIADKIKPKLLSIIGALLITIGALYPVVFHGNIGLLYFSNFIMGVGQGIVLTVQSILISQVYEDPKRGQFLGIRGSLQQIGSMLMMYVAGWLATRGWYNVYWTGLITVPALLICIFMLPDLEKAEETRKAADTPKEKGIPLETWIIAIFIFFWGVPFAVNIINSAMLLQAQLNLGPEMAGTTSAITGIIAVLSGFIYKGIAKYIKQYMLAFGTVFLVVGLYLQYICTSYWVFLLGGCGVSVGFIFTFTGGIHAIPRLVGPARVAFGVGFYLALQSLGSMLTPYLVNPIAEAFNNGVSSASGNYLVAVIWGLVALVASLIWAFTHSKNYIDNPEVSV